MLFDTHAHMNDPAFDEDRDEILRTLPEKGVHLMVNIGCSLASSRDCVEMANRYPHVYATVGSHPDSADEVNDVVLEEYRKLCKLNPKVKAIGEIGL
ncbi:MAG: TatD family hydrolase, partial [Oscillospiraceae bacterium]|nr:TatD family hydrolase [Oscillospiraceae bacterium]